MPRMIFYCNHLGNVLATVSDRKIAASTSSTGSLEYFEVAYTSFTDYYPFGMLMPSRTYHAPSTDVYRFGFNGMEKDNEVKGDGNSLDFGARIYDSRLGRFMSPDNLASKAPSWSPYRYAFDSPIFFGDNDGDYEDPKNGWQRFWNFVSGKGNYNAFADFKAEIEKSGVGRIENIDYSNKSDIQYTLIRSFAMLEPNTSQETKAYISTVAVRAITTDRLSFDEHYYGNKLTNITFDELISNEVDASLAIGKVNPLTGKVKGGGDLDPIYIEYDIIEFIVSGGGLTVVRKAAILGAKKSSKRIAKKLSPDRSADGNHSTWELDNNGKKYKWSTWKKEKGKHFSEVERYDGGGCQMALQVHRIEIRKH